MKLWRLWVWKDLLTSRKLYMTIISPNWRKRYGSLFRTCTDNEWSLGHTHSPTSCIHYFHLKLIHSANPKSRPVGIIGFSHVVRPSPLFKSRKTKQQKTLLLLGWLWVWPSGSLMTTVLFVLFCEILKSGDGRMTCVKIVITSDHDCGSVDYIMKLI